MALYFECSIFWGLISFTPFAQFLLTLYSIWTCNTHTEQIIYFSNSLLFPNVNLKFEFLGYAKTEYAIGTHGFR